MTEIGKIIMEKGKERIINLSSEVIDVIFIDIFELESLKDLKKYF